MAHAKLAALLSIPLLICSFAVSGSLAQTAEDNAAREAKALDDKRKFCEDRRKLVRGMNNQIADANAYLARPENADNQVAKDQVAEAVSTVAKIEAGIEASNCPPPQN